MICSQRALARSQFTVNRYVLRGRELAGKVFGRAVWELADQDPIPLQQLEREICVMQHVQSPHLGAREAIMIDESCMEIILLSELAPYGSLHDFRARNWGNFSMYVYIRVLSEMAAALLCLHRHGVVHLDVKPDNFIVIADPRFVQGPCIKLIDYGISRTLLTASRAATAAEGLGTYAYMAPEQLLQGERIGSKSDVYSFGITALEFITRKNELAILRRSEVRYFYETNGVVRVHDSAVPFHLAHILQMCLLRDPRQRYSMHQVADLLQSLISQLPALPVPGLQYGGPVALTTCNNRIGGCGGL